MIENFPSLSPLASSLPFQKNEYEFLSLIGFGGSSAVFKVKSSNYLSTFFAAKVTPKTKGLNLLELKILKSLDHSYIINVYDFFEDDLNYYLILEYCENGSLFSMIKSGQITTNEEIIFYMKRISDALFFCHSKGIAHRDIKPSNVLIDAYGRPKLIDFGICEIPYSDDSNLSESTDDNENKIDYFSARKHGKIKLVTKFFGSAPYLAPEVILKESYDPFSADIWSLGVTFFELATGSLPWDRFPEKMREEAICQSMVIFPSSTPKPIQKLISSMMQVDPKQRPTIRSIVRCSLFNIEIPSSLKIFSIRKTIRDKSPNTERQEERKEEFPKRTFSKTSLIPIPQREAIKCSNKEIPKFTTSRSSRRSSNPTQKSLLYQKSNLPKPLRPQIQNKMTFFSSE